MHIIVTYNRALAKDDRVIFTTETQYNAGQYSDNQNIISKYGIKTCMEDPIPSKLMSSAIDVVLPVLTTLVNQSLSEGSMDGINWSVLDPLLKKAGLDSDTKKNYRPVNNLLFMSKLPERVVGIRLDERRKLAGSILNVKRRVQGNQFGIVSNIFSSFRKF